MPGDSGLLHRKADNEFAPLRELQARAWKKQQSSTEAPFQPEHGTLMPSAVRGSELHRRARMLVEQGRQALRIARIPLVEENQVHSVCFSRMRLKNPAIHVIRRECRAHRGG